MNNRFDTVAMVLDGASTPSHFVWRGQRYRIDGIDRIWRPAHNQPQGSRTYRVRCNGLPFLLQHDRQRNRWQIVRSPVRLRLSLALDHLARRVAA